MKLYKKYIILIGVFAVLIIIFILSKVLKKDNFDERLVTLLTNKNYVKDTGTMYAYDDEEYSYKECLDDDSDCLGKKYYFDTTSYKLVLDEVLKSEDVVFSFTPTYNYKNKNVTYFYRIRYKNGSIVIKGDYDDENFNCDVDYSYGINVDDKEVYCDMLPDKLKTFRGYAHLLIDDTTILNGIQKKK